jgi:acyl carrier protein
MPVIEGLRAYVLDTYLFASDQSALGNDGSFLSDRIIDSTGIVDLVIFSEEQFGLKVDDVELLPENFDSIELLAQFVARKNGQTPAQVQARI